MPFTILHVCVGNICRSPMAERLLALALRGRLGVGVEDLYLSHGAGTGSWHVGEPMNAPAARLIAQRGGDPSDFIARKLTNDMIETSDLILCATAWQVTGVLTLVPSAGARTFVLGEFGRLLPDADLSWLPAFADDPHARGVALVEAVDACRVGPSGDRRRPRDDDDLDDPYGMPDSFFARTADTIERTVVPLASALTSRP
jgi:protein-tyrosine phosphatase